MTSLWQDIRYGLRMLGRSPGFAVISILTLGLGIAATTTIWSVVDSVLLEPFPYDAANRLATPSVSFPDEGSIKRFPVPIFLDFKEQNRTFEDIIGLAYTDVHYKRSAGTEQLVGAWVTPNTFTFLGIKPLLGREITQEDGKPSSPPVFVMSYTLWTRLFKGKQCQFEAPYGLFCQRIDYQLVMNAKPCGIDFFELFCNDSKVRSGSLQTSTTF
jgi:putative ABC transport system permease protein